MNSCQNNPEKSYTEKEAKHEPSGWTLFTNCSFDKTKNTHDYYRGIDCIEVLCKKLKKHALEIINYIKKEVIPLSEEENKFYEEQDVCYICKKKFCFDENNENDNNKNEKYQKVKDHCHYTGKFRGAAHNICNLRYKTPKEIPIVIHNAGYDTHFIINQLSKEFEGEFDCIGKNMEKYITFSVPIKKKCCNGKTISYKLKFINSFRFMSTSLSNLVDNLSEINKKECKTCIERKNMKSKCDFIGTKDNKLNYKCNKCHKKWFKPVNELIKKFLSIY